MPEAPAKRAPTCCICGFGLKDARCPHPWLLPFDEWPADLMKRIHELAPWGYDDPPR